MMGTTICACQLAASGVHHTTAGRPFSDRRAAAQSNAKRVRRSSVQRAGVCMRRQRSQALDSSKTSETGWRTAPRHHPSRHTTGETRLARRGGEAAEVPWPGQAAPPSRALFCFSANKSFARALPPASLRPPGLSARVAARCHPLIRQSGLGGVARAPPALPPGPRAVTERRPFASHSKWIALRRRRSRSRSRSRAARHGTARAVVRSCWGLEHPAPPPAPWLVPAIEQSQSAALSPAPRSGWQSRGTARADVLSSAWGLVHPAPDPPTPPCPARSRPRHTAPHLWLIPRQRVVRGGARGCVRRQGRGGARQAGGRGEARHRRRTCAPAGGARSHARGRGRGARGA